MPSNLSALPFTVPARGGSPTIPVAWSGTDPDSGVASYDVQVKVDDGAWTAWLTATTATEAVYSGELGHLYTFRARATDHVNNTGAWAEASTVVVQVTKYYAFGGQRIAMRSGDQVSYLHADHLGSTSLLSDASGNGIPGSRVSYYPYGETRTGDLASLPTDFGFTGQRNESTIGLYDYRARFYDPVLGRFVSADTLVPNPGNPQDLNRYAYVRNNPLRYTDPSGYCIPGVNCPDDPPRPAWSPPSGYRPQSTEEQIALLGWVQAQTEIEEAETGGTVVTLLNQQSLNLELSTLMKYVSPEKAERLAWQGAMMGAPSFVAAAGTLAGDLGEDAVSAVQQAVSKATTGERLELTDTYQRWRPGDPINAPTRHGYPSWSTVKRRYWKNAAYYAEPGEYSDANLARMRTGRAELHESLAVSKELHHIWGREGPDPHNPTNLIEVWPWEHADIDPHRYYNGPRP